MVSPPTVMECRLKHASLGSTLTGIKFPNGEQFRGIPYGKVAARFARPRAAEALPPTLDCTKFGPRCPQVPVDVRQLCRIPPRHTLPREPEDEFGCLNLDVTTPRTGASAAGHKVPVLLWIHGGSQSVTFGSAASGLCDPRNIVADSVELGSPIIAVTVQYRLNIFAFGDGSSPTNLALQDQALALGWVREHIAGFGGDANAITLAGESAGAVYCHAHLVMKAPISQCILSSGSLYLSPPQPGERADAVRRVVTDHLRRLDEGDIRGAPADVLVEVLRICGLQSWFLQTEPALEAWRTELGDAQRVMISDVADEAVLWREGIWSMPADEVVAAFDLAGDRSDGLKSMYNIFPGRRSSCVLGALDFINDYKFLLPAQKLAGMYGMAGRPAFRCLVDEPNPWQPSNGAHHAVDLVLLFGGFDLSLSPLAQRTGQSMRHAWIRFVNSEAPWGPAPAAVFGPLGKFEVLDESGLGLRRRLSHARFLEATDPIMLDKVFAALAVGRISLLN
ncbi:Lipase 1 [Colletotrichum sidae]|uniref:Carboxylic ester hydrolase n=1 Tax=Colletotrichum sidae TaxID=1347389 RepID=A0A4R8SVN3_9PEZI|nr:Lipase 1 [Colletotrichum sidae]